MQTQELLRVILDNLGDFKAVNVTSLDVRQITSITEYMVICTGNSARHVRAIAENLIDKMEALHIKPRGFESDTENEWVLVDFGDIVVHIMQARARDFYQLEKLWAPSLYDSMLSIA